MTYVCLRRFCYVNSILFTILAILSLMGVGAIYGIYLLDGQQGIYYLCTNSTKPVKNSNPKSSCTSSKPIKLDIKNIRNGLGIEASIALSFGIANVFALISAVLCIRRPDHFRYTSWLLPLTFFAVLGVFLMGSPFKRVMSLINICGMETHDPLSKLLMSQFWCFVGYLSCILAVLILLGLRRCSYKWLQADLDRMKAQSKNLGPSIIFHKGSSIGSPPSFGRYRIPRNSLRPVEIPVRLEDPSRSDSSPYLWSSHSSNAHAGSDIDKAQLINPVQGENVPLSFINESRSEDNDSLAQFNQAFSKTEAESRRTSYSDVSRM